MNPVHLSNKIRAIRWSRRSGVVVLLLLVSSFILVACNGDEEDSGGASNQGGIVTATASATPLFIRNTLPPTVELDVREGFQTPTATSVQGRRTLPPRSTLVIPTSTQPSTFTPTATVATSTPTATLDIQRGEEPPECVTFRSDVERNAEVETIFAGQPAKIYWFPATGDGFTYLIEIFDANAFSIYSTEVTVTELEFPVELLTASNFPYVWTVTAYRNGVPSACAPLDGEIFVR